MLLKFLFKQIKHLVWVVQLVSMEYTVQQTMISNSSHSDFRNTF